MTKKTFLKSAFIPSIGLAVLAVSSASAMTFGQMNMTPQDMATRQQAMFQEQATLLGISVDDVKAAWASGTDVKTLAKQKGISLDIIKQKMQAKRLEEQKTMLSTFVSQGVITQAQADQRLAAMMAKNAKGYIGEGKHGGRGFGMMGL